MKMNRTVNSKYSIAGAVALITFIVYLPSLADNFVMWDDGAYVVTNPHIRSFNLAFFRWAFLKSHAANWHPLTWISHALDYAIWGLNPLGHHLTSIILHAVNAFIVVLLAMRLLQAGKEEPAQTGFPGFMNERGILIAAGATGLLFGLHPVHVESVAWVAERKDLLCALFFLLSIITYTDYAGSAQEGTSRKNPFLLFLNKRYVFTIGFFVLALLSKPMAVTLPVVLLILDWCPFNRVRSLKTFLFALAEKIPFFLLSLISSIITILAQQKAMMPRVNAPLSARPLVAVDAVIRYLGKMILPVDLVPFYPYPNHVSLFSFKYLSALALVAGITLACIAAAKKREIWLAAWGYFIVTLVPVIGLVQVGSQSMADRYTYLPSLGPFLIVGLGVAWISAKAFSVDKPSLLIQFLMGAMAIIVLFTLTYLTVKQCGIWKDRLTFWTYVVEREPASPIPHNDLGMAYEDKGMIDQAIEQYLIALRLSPRDADFHVNLGQAYDDKGLIDQAVEQYQIALRSDPTHALAHNNLGVAFRKQGLIDKAIEQYHFALKLESDNALFHNNLGVAYGENGLQDKALEQYQIALQLEPENALARNNLGMVYAQEGFLDEAISQYLIALQWSPHDADIHYNLGLAYQNKGLIDQAVEQYQIAVISDPKHALAHNNLGIAFKKQGLIDKAIEQYQIALKLESGNALFHNNLGVAYEVHGLIDKAVEQYKIALRLDANNLLARTNLAEVYAEKGLIDLSIAQYEAVLKLRPNSVEAHTNLGLAYLKKGFKDQAIRQFSLAVALHPGSPMAHSNLGAAYGKLGFTDKAIEQFRIAVKLDPANPTYRNNLDNAYKNKKQSPGTHAVTQQ